MIEWNIFNDGYVPVIMGLSRVNQKDVFRAWYTVKGVVTSCIHRCIATSEIHEE